MTAALTPWRAAGMMGSSVHRFVAGSYASTARMAANMWRSTISPPAIRMRLPKVAKAMLLRAVGMEARGAPGVRSRIVDFDDVGVAARGSKSGSKAAADHINFAADYADRGVIAGRGHGHARLPRIGGRIVNFVCIQRLVRHLGSERNELRARMDGSAADHVDLAIHFRCDWGHARGGHRREGFPGISDGIVLPGIIRRELIGTVRLRLNRAAEEIDFACISHRGEMMRGKRHVLFLSPVIGGGIVFLHEPRRHLLIA